MKLEQKGYALIAGVDAAARDAAAVVTGCAWCAWEFVGTVGAGRDASVEHRRVEHGVVAAKKKMMTRAEMIVESRRRGAFARSAAIPADE